VPLSRPITATATPISRFNPRKMTLSRRVDPKLKNLEQEYSSLKHQRDELIAFVRKLRILKQFRAKVRKKAIQIKESDLSCMKSIDLNGYNG
jgi:hypothetical protein